MVFVVYTYNLITGFRILGSTPFKILSHFTISIDPLTTPVFNSNMQSPNYLCSLYGYPTQSSDLTTIEFDLMIDVDSIHFRCQINKRYFTVQEFSVIVQFIDLSRSFMDRQQVSYTYKQNQTIGQLNLIWIKIPDKSSNCARGKAKYGPSRSSKTKMALFQRTRLIQCQIKMTREDFSVTTGKIM